MHFSQNEGSKISTPVFLCFQRIMPIAYTLPVDLTSSRSLDKLIILNVSCVYQRVGLSFQVILRVTTPV